MNHSSASDLQAFLDWGCVISSLTSRPESFWRELLSTWFLNNPVKDALHTNSEASSSLERSSASSSSSCSSSSCSSKKVEERITAAEKGALSERGDMKAGEDVERSLLLLPSPLHSEGVGVVCYPSIALSTRYHEEDALREQTLREEIGEKALKELSDLVEQYKEEQKEAPPRDILTSVPVAKIEKVYLPRKCPLSNFDDPPSVSPAPSSSSSACPEREEREKEGAERKPGEMRERANREKEKNEDKRIEQNIQQETQKDVNMGVSEELEENKKNEKMEREEEKKRKEEEEDRCRRKKEMISRALDQLSFACQIDHNPGTEFINIKLLSRIPMESLTCEEQLSLVLLSDLLFECDILLPNSVVSSSLFNLSSPSSTSDEKTTQEKPSPEGYTRVPYETLTRLLFEHATSSSSGFGLYSESGAAPGSPSVLYHLFTLSITAPVDRYEQAVTLLLSVLCGVQIEPCRVSVHLKRHLKQLTRKKRSGKFLVQQIETGLRYKKSSYPNVAGWGRQLRFLKRMERDLLSLTRFLRSAYEKLFSRGRDICLALVADISQLPLDWDTPWKDLQTKLSRERRALLDFSASSSSSSVVKAEEEEKRVAAGKSGERSRMKEREKEEEKNDDPVGCCDEKGEKDKTEREVSEWRVPREGRVKKFEEISKILRIEPAACDNLFSQSADLRARLQEEKEEEEASKKKKKRSQPTTRCRLACGIGSSDAGHVLVSVQAPVGYRQEEEEEKSENSVALLVMAECCSMMEGTEKRTP